MNQGLVGVDNLFQIDGLVTIVGEGCIFIEVLVSLDDILYRSRSLDDCCAEDASCKVTTIGDKVYICVEITLNLLQTLTDLCDVLMLEGFVDAQIIVAPREMGSGAWLLTGTRRTRDGIDGNILLEQVQMGGRQQ